MRRNSLLTVSRYYLSLFACLLRVIRECKRSRFGTTSVLASRNYSFSGSRVIDSLSWRTNDPWTRRSFRSSRRAL